MRPSLLPLLAMVAALAVPVGANEFDSPGFKFKSSAVHQPGPVPGCGTAAKPCVCESPHGRKYFHFILYQQNYVAGSPFTNEIEAAAGVVMSRAKVELIKPPENDQGTGGHQLFNYPKQADCDRRSAQDKKEKPVCVMGIDDQIAFCQVVRDAFKAHAPPAGYFPMFLMTFGGVLKKQIGTDVAGEYYPKGIFKSRCGAVGEDQDVPETAFAVVDVQPDKENNQVLIHEMGHGIGDSVGHKDWFQDQYPGVNAPADSRNIMLSRKAIGDWHELEMSPFQVSALCGSPYVSDKP